MNKAMIAATAAVLGASVASAAIESTNVVGYQACPVEAGYKMVTPTFAAVDGGAYDVNQLQIVGSTDDATSTIQTMDAAGKWTGMYFWFNEYDDGTEYYPAGWFADRWGETPAEITLKGGEGVYLYTPDKSASVQTAGSVAGKIELPVATGYSMIGNGSPVTISVDDLQVVGSTEDATSTIQTMDAKGKWTGMYFWFNEYNDGTEYYPAGWFADRWGETPADINLAPGESVYFYTPDTGVKVTVPSAL